MAQTHLFHASQLRGWFGDTLGRLCRPLGAALIVAVFLLDLSLPLGYAGGMLYILPVLLGLWAASDRYVVVVVAVATGLTVAGFIFSPAAATIATTVYLNRALALVAVWVTGFGVLLYRRAASHLRASNEEIAQTNATLQRSQERLIASQRAARIGSWEWVLPDGPLWCSEEIDGIVGVADCSELSIEQLRRHVLPADLPELQDAIKRLTSDDEPLSLRFRLIAADESVRVVRLVGRYERTAELERVLGTAQDITDTVRLEDEFLQIQRTEAVGRLAGSIAHDFNNLLMGIRGGLTVALKRLPRDHDVRGGLEEVLNATDDGAQITRQLLTFSARHDDQDTRSEVDAMLADLGNMLGRLVGEHILFDMSLDASGAWIGVDRGRLQQVIMNLVVNARDAMPDDGTLTIRTRADDSKVELIVTDTGCGMDDETRQRIFDPFFTTKGVGRGTGLGLATVNRIVNDCDGTIQVESRVGQGTTFHLELPRVAPGEVESNSWLSEPLDVAGQTILLVDDERLVGLAVQHYLESAGFRVLTAMDAPQALELLRQNPKVELMLTDVVLPGQSGPALAEVVRETRPEMHVMFMSAYSAEMLVRDERVPADAAILQKPFTEAQLLDVLRVELSAPAETKKTNGRQPSGRRAILLVEDQPLSREATAELLGDTGYEVLTAATGAEARACFAERGDEIGLIITDLGLPDVDGAELVTQLRAEGPELPVVYATGSSLHDKRVQTALDVSTSHFVQKPIDFVHLEALVMRLMQPG